MLDKGISRKDREKTGRTSVVGRQRVYLAAIDCVHLRQYAILSSEVSLVHALDASPLDLGYMVSMLVSTRLAHVNAPIGEVNVMTWIYTVISICPKAETQWSIHMDASLTTVAYATRAHAAH
jgi:hypothetical protein